MGPWFLSGTHLSLDKISPIAGFAPCKRIGSGGSKRFAALTPMFGVRNQASGWTSVRRDMTPDRLAVMPIYSLSCTWWLKYPVCHQ